jgi:crossover junction endodeoxyribonuclease RuvC
MGVDPGTLKTGYAFLKKSGSKIETLDFGLVRPPPTLPLMQRLLAILEALQELGSKFQPTELAIESQFVKKNVQVALKLGMARGMAIAAVCHSRKIPVFEYAPKKVKLSIVGFGGASKIQVQKMVQKLLNLKQMPAEDAADALAIAFCHVNQNLTLKTLYV